VVATSDSEETAGQEPAHLEPKVRKVDEGQDGFVRGKHGFADHEPLIGREPVEEVPVTGLSFVFWQL
jgi:hypothetical protein